MPRTTIKQSLVQFFQVSTPIVWTIAAAIGACNSSTGVPPGGVASVGGNGAPLVPTSGTLSSAPSGTAGMVASGPAAGTSAGAATSVAAASGTGAIGTGAGGIGAGGIGAGGSGSSPVPGSPTFSAVFQDIIVGTGCNGGPTCHAGMVGGKLIMLKAADTYAALVDMPAMGTNVPAGGMNCVDSGLKRVAPGDPDKSLLVQKVEMMTPPCGQHMPPGPTMLKPEQLMQLRAWIKNGAKND